jgi:hypothetical protein
MIWKIESHPSSSCPPPTDGMTLWASRIAVLLLLLAPVISLQAAEADVIVYGSKPGGFCAAIAAAREGASVILLEPTEHVGGLNTGGLSHSDSNQIRRETLLGLFDEWQLYVRESRRMKGIHVITQKDILDSPEKEDPIAISSFPIDSHDCQRVALKGGGVINEGTIFPVRFKNPKVGYAYHVPYRSVLPKPSQCNNLLVPVALSSTHVAMSSLRIEGAWMAIGQGSGIAAALAAKRGVGVQDLPYPILRERLLAQGQVLKLPAPPVAPATKPTNQ